MDERRLLLGDWGRWIRDPIDLLRLCFIAGALIYLVLERSTAIELVAASIVLVIARFLNLPRPYDPPPPAHAGTNGRSCAET